MTVEIEPNTFAVLSTMKNEAPYILDWVAHYYALGFDRMIVASNDCTDTTDHILDRLEELGVLIHHHTKKRPGGIQRSAIRQCIRHPKIETAEWVFICDADEYLNIHLGDGSVQDLVKYSGEDMDAIAIPWRIFGPDGIEKILRIPVTEQFRVGEFAYDPGFNPEAARHKKSLVRNRDKFLRMGVHEPVPEQGEDAPPSLIVHPGGEPSSINGVYQKKRPSFEYAQVNHYALRGLDGYLVKKARGRVNHSRGTMGLWYWKQHNRDGEIDTSIDRYKEKKNSILNEFLNDEELQRLHIKGIKWHRRHAQEIKQDPEFADALKTLRGLNRGNLIKEAQDDDKDQVKTA